MRIPSHGILSGRFSAKPDEVLAAGLPLWSRSLSLSVSTRRLMSSGYTQPCSIPGRYSKRSPASLPAL
jgi:hypothetical protein